MIVVTSLSPLKLALNHLNDFGPWRSSFQRIFIVDTKRIGTGIDSAQRTDFIDNFSKTALKSSSCQQDVRMVNNVSGQVIFTRLGMWITYATGMIPTTGTKCERR
jgi:hypothetical protein